jgi:hypothetical protein
MLQIGCCSIAGTVIGFKENKNLLSKVSNAVWERLMQALLALAAILQPMISAAHAEDWWLVSYGGAKPERMVVFVDKQSVTRSANIVRAWEADYHEASEAGGPAGYTKALFEYDCTRKTFKTISLLEQRADGVAIDKAIEPGFASAAPVAAGTMGDTEMKFACGQSVGATQIGGGLDVARVGKAILDGLDGAVASK